MKTEIIIYRYKQTGNMTDIKEYSKKQEICRKEIAEKVTLDNYFEIQEKEIKAFFKANNDKISGQDGDYFEGHYWSSRGDYVYTVTFDNATCGKLEADLMEGE